LAADHTLSFGIAAYLTACLLLCMLMFAAHMKASNSRAIRDARRSLRIIRYPQMP
jgi:hypothetical protein